MSRFAFCTIILLFLAACGGSGSSDSGPDPADTPDNSYSTTDLRSKELVNPAAYIPAQCFTVTQPDEGGRPTILVTVAIRHPSHPTT